MNFKGVIRHKSVGIIIILIGFITIISCSCSGNKPQKPSAIEGVDSTLVLLQSRTKDRITVHRNYGEIPEIECRPTKLNQVFMNILSNAIDSIEERGDIFIDTSMNKSNIIIKIRDTGKGMSKKTSSHVFEPFYTTKDVGEGMGLGLSVSYGIIEQHKGRIDLRSEPGSGSEFIIALPISQGE